MTGDLREGINMLITVSGLPSLNLKSFRGNWIESAALVSAHSPSELDVLVVHMLKPSFAAKHYATKVMRRTNHFQSIFFFAFATHSIMLCKSVQNY
jgi:hypothetical protein